MSTHHQRRSGADRKIRLSPAGRELLPTLIKCWAVLRATAGKLLAPMLPVLVPTLRAERELTLSLDSASGPAEERRQAPVAVREP